MPMPCSALGVHLLAQALTLHLTASKPPGTGGDGSPSGQTLRVELALMFVSVIGLASPG